MMKIDEILALAVERKASDIHFSSAVPPLLRIDGELSPVSETPLDPAACRELCYSILSDERRHKFETDRELDFSYGISGLGRFRVNYYFQRGSVAAAFRLISSRIPTFDDLGLPAPVLNRFCGLSRGYILATGPTGSGKSTTLASMIDHINRSQNCHIITIEDPIEYLFRNRQSMVNQRELGDDTRSFAEGLKHCLRQDPDVIMVGEMRDLETVTTSLALAETGHLVLSTLHSGEATETISRIIDIFPPGQQQQVRVQLSLSLSGVIAQQLLPRADGQGRVIATEVMVINPAIRNLIREGKPQEIQSHIQMGSGLGMHTMNSSLARLAREGEITRETALNASFNVKELTDLLNRAGK